jgi:serine/threonine protein kinase
MKLTPPQRVGRYVLTRYLRGGVLGNVWEAHNPHVAGWGEELALEFLDERLARSHQQLRRFRQRFARLKAPWFHHPAAVPCYELEEWQGVPYVVMKHVDGETLARVLSSRGSLEPDEALIVARDLACLLRHAHASGIAHGGLTAETVVLTGAGKPRALDFGLAAAWHGWERTPACRVGFKLAELRRADAAALAGLLRQLLAGPSLDSSGGPRSGELGIAPPDPPPLPSAVPPALTLSWRHVENAPGPWGQMFLSELASLDRSWGPKWPTAPFRGATSVRREPTVHLQSEAATSDRDRTATLAPTSQPEMALSQERVEGYEPQPQPERPHVLPPPIRAIRPPWSRLSYPSRTAIVRLLMAASLLVGAAVTLALPDSRPHPRATGAVLHPHAASRPVLHPPFASGPAPERLATVPGTAGIPVLAARDRLADVGLRLASVRPVEGPPGKVVRSVPAVGARVRVGAGVTLLVGAPPERLTSTPQSG